MNQPEFIDDRRGVGHYVNGVLPRKGLARVLRNDGEAKPAGDRFQDHADMIDEAAARQATDAGVARENAAEQAAGHGLPVRMVDEADAFEIAPALNFLSSGYDEFERFLGEYAGGDPGIVRAVGHQSEFVAVLHDGFKHFRVGGEAVADDQFRVGCLQVEQQRVNGEADTARADQRDVAAISVGFRQA